MKRRDILGILGSSPLLGRTLVGNVRTATAGALAGLLTGYRAHAATPSTDPLLIYDGADGITKDWLYKDRIPWANVLGDWLDAAGVQQGTNAFGSVAVAPGATGTLSLDVTSLVQQGIEPQIALVSLAGSPNVQFNSRESGAGGPVLKVTYTDGAVDTVPVTYDVYTDPSTVYALGADTALRVSPTNRSYLRFPAPAKPVASATLLLSIKTVLTAGSVKAMQFACHRPAPSNDGAFTLVGDPRVFFQTQAFDDAPLWTRAGIYGDKTHGILDPYNQRNLVDDGEGGKALQITFDPAVNNACETSVLFPNFDEVDEAAIEYDIKFLPDMLTGLRDGIKCFAGFSSSTKNDDAYFASWTGSEPGRCGTLLAGNGGSKSHGYDGWSMRFNSMKSPAAPHPLNGYFLPDQYDYWPGQWDYYGDSLLWNLGSVGLKVNEWHRIAMRLRINSCVGTDYKKDAEFDGYVNGVLAARWRNFYLRTTDTPTISRPPYNVRSNLRIGRIWIASYHGGTSLPLARCSFLIRNFRAAVLTGGTLPPPPPPGGGGGSNGGNNGGSSGGVTSYDGNVQGLWWAKGGTESGWGINFVHQGDQVFATWYTYDVAGKAWWLSMLAAKTSTGSYTGSIYATTGSPFNRVPFAPLTASPAPLGTGTLTFADANSGSFAYSLNAAAQTKAISRFDLATGPQPVCTYSATDPNYAAATNYQDLWWVANGAEAGWGVNFAHQGDSVFATWYTYDVDGKPMWLSVLAQRVGTTKVYAGTLYRSSGPRFDAYDPAKLVSMQVGTATLTFIDGNTADFHYTTTGLGGLPSVAQTKRITRFRFAAVGGTICR